MRFICSTRGSRKLIVISSVFMALAFLLATALATSLLSGSASAQMGGGGGMGGDMAKGAEIFRANCSSCHGDKGEGGKKSWIDNATTAPTIAGMGGMMIQNAVRNGFAPQMPAFPHQEISDTELQSVMQYVRNLPGSYIAPPAAQHTITITDEDPWYNPMQISINPGDTVRFVNTGKTYHPGTQIEYVTSEGTEGVDSGLLAPGASWYYTFDTPGKFTFICKIHPYMRGEVYVGQGFTPPSYSVDAPAPLPTVPGVGEVWVAAQWQDWPGKAKDGVVQVIDASTWTVTSQIPVGNNPHHLWFNGDESKLLATSWYDNYVSLIDGNTKQVTGNYVAGTAPAHSTCDPGLNWDVTIEGSNYLQYMRQSDMALNGKTTVSGFGPHGVWYGGNKIVTSNSMDSTLSAIDANTKAEMAYVKVGLYPLGAGVNSTGTIAATGNCLGSSVSIVDIVNEVKVRDIPVSGCAVQVPFTPDDRYIAVAHSPYLSVIDVAKAMDTVNYPDPASAIVGTVWTGKGAHGVDFGEKSGGGLYAYVTNKYENYVSVVDMATVTKAGDVPLVTTTTGKVALVGATDTGAQGVATRTTASQPPADVTAPVTTLSPMPPSGWLRKSYSGTLSCNDNGGSGCAKTEYRINGGAWITGTSIYINTKGTHTVEYRSTDAAGNVENTRSATVRIR